MSNVSVKTKEIRGECNVFKLKELSPYEFNRPFSILYVTSYRLPFDCFRRLHDLAYHLIIQAPWMHLTLYYLGVFISSTEVPILYTCEIRTCWPVSCQPMSQHLHVLSSAGTFWLKRHYYFTCHQRFWITFRKENNGLQDLKIYHDTCENYSITILSEFYSGSNAHQIFLSLCGKYDPCASELTCESARWLLTIWHRFGVKTF